ncbi:MAG: hypothetical protein A2268_10895 [Candidatus Raymondbacteria bacterium RifOxyA12_full_50_37]|uniref:HTH tetR-type domain-containing protein n=1 Tax=Candidatus Raymondbacteria bacterium RIFOXYD12_FULL_49_13 TaxID=1817890 RepID=A0A1F7F1Z1_UNCRA|nr:MAG: hypothetical protein A2268_10895 [Candidatus Raymondbacteria bacterium RifOxyA12_full_50_37]OGJ85518.1 MAG: hypothetical protein A2248_12680 [Candidatus Raymondbacteria bacterium RIFOXYA2_FULL_49_16]OGJ95021.1 MAG: hypothetical protein A2453_07380 [Candidatus Raymondbacteria bacterium RIFOXYC2_FULL_50_21]OGK00685.1 MAG: hypothetical protein A2519_20015 [Candidatus Raymondbacteria bacterium RIFOXYD12_FULL_49_13]OGK01290.1 MAG: hypothetical protein A2350_08370 [Candidatus Raymondbacteria 
MAVQKSDFGVRMEELKETREKAVRDAKRNLILDASVKVFGEKGFHETRLEDIAAQAGFSKASLYNYYEDKESIFLHLAIREHERLCDKFETLDLPKDSFQSALRTFLTVLVHEMGARFAFIAAVSNFQTGVFCGHETFGKHRETLIKQFQTAVARIQEQILRLVSQAKSSGEIRSPLSEQAITKYISSIIRGIMYEWKIKGKMGDITVEVNEILEFVCHGATGPAQTA